MKKTFLSRTKTAMAAAAMTAAGASSASADVVAINFMGDGYGDIGSPVTADAFGVGVGDWTDVDAADANGSVTVNGIGFAWTITNDWNMGVIPDDGNSEVMSGYLDDPGVGANVNITGLADWLVTTGDATYTIQGIQSSDSASSFSDIQLTNNDFGIGTLTNSTTGTGAIGGATSLSAEFSLDEITMMVDGRNGSRRGTLSGIIVSSVSAVPEPGSAGLIVLSVIGMAFVRRRSD